MRRTITTVVGLCIVTGFVAGYSRTAFGQPAQVEAEAGDAKEILEKAAAALQKIKFASYEGEYTATGWVTAFVPKVEGSAALGEPSKYDIVRFRSEARMTSYESNETTALTAGSDGDMFFVIDPQAKMVYADIDEAVLGTHQRNIQRLLMREFVAKEPLADDLKVEKIELKETTNVGDEPCYQVQVTRSETRAVVWFISKRDWLPRRVDRLYTEPERGEGLTRLVLTNLVARTTFSPEPFKVVVPPGYTKTDEFAP